MARHGRERRTRLMHRPLLDFLIGEALDQAARRGIPVQFHTGFGDPDLDLAAANPLLLRSTIERWPAVPLVLLHAGYPYCREAGWLAAVYPNVHVDFGLAVPFLSTSGMRHALRALLETAPWSKLMYASDASRIPELFYLGARAGRRVLGEVLDDGVRDGDLTFPQAETAAAAMLAGNARQLYSAEARPATNSG